MEINLIVIGKTIASYLKEGEKEYVQRLQHYCKLSYTTIPDVKNVQKLSEEQRKKEEGKLIAKKIDPTDYVILLDENGKSISSKKLAKLIEQHQIQSTKKIVFIVGGAYGFSDEVYQRANQKISLSSMTFSHQMVRIFFLEQLYRAHTILRGEPYHHG